MNLKGRGETERERERERKEHKDLYNFSSDVRVVNENCGDVGIGLRWETQFFWQKNHFKKGHNYDTKKLQ